MDLKGILHTAYLTREQGEYLLNALINDPFSWEEFLKWDKGKPSIIAARILEFLNAFSKMTTDDNYKIVSDELYYILSKNDFKVLRTFRSPEKFWGLFNMDNKNKQHSIFNRFFPPSKLLDDLDGYDDNNNKEELPEKPDDGVDVFKEVANRDQQRIQRKIMANLSALDLEILIRAYVKDEKSESIARDLYDKGRILCDYKPPSEDWLNAIIGNVNNRKKRAKDFCRKEFDSIINYELKEY